MKGAKYRKPPPTYYSLEGKEEEIRTIGEDPEMFKELGILIDPEETGSEKNFLLQIFSFPVFDANTFFMEVIQRRGSTGFGGGNIRALAMSIVEYEKEFKERLLEAKAKLTRKPSKKILKTRSLNDLECLFYKALTTMSGL